MEINNVNENDFYVSKDLNLISFLVYSGLEIHSIKQDETQGNLWFCFVGSSRCRELEEMFWQLKARVEPVVYENTKKTIKQMIVSNRLNSKVGAQDGGVLLSKTKQYEKRKT